MAEFTSADLPIDVYSAQQELRAKVLHELNWCKARPGEMRDVALKELLGAAAALAGSTPVIPSDQAIIADGGSVSVKNSAGTVTKAATAHVAANAVTGVSLPATTAILDNGASLTVTDADGTPGVSGTITVANGAAGVVTLAAGTNAVVSNAAACVITGPGGGTQDTGTLVVAGGVVKAALSANKAVVSNGDTPAVTGTGTTATIAVSATGVVTITLS